VVAAIDHAVQTLERLGATVEEVKLPDYALFNACGRVIMLTEAFAIHEQDYQARPLDFGLLTYLRMTIGAFVTAADLHQATRLRRELSHAVNRQLKTCDALITASALAPAPAFAEFLPQAMLNLPLSVQIAGRAFDEQMVLRIGAALEAAMGMTAKRPALAEIGPR